MLRTPKKDFDKLKDKEALTQYAIYLLAQRDYSEAGLLDKLKSYALVSNEADEVLDRMIELGYASDERYVEQRVRYRMECSGHGPMKIKMDLKMKGAPQHLIDMAIETIDKDVWTQNCINLCLRRYHAPADTAKERDKRLRYLVNKGFNYSDATIALDSISKIDIK